MTGDKKVEQLFDADKLPRDLYEGLLASIRKSTAEMEAAVRALVPVKTGALAATIGSKVAKGHGFISGTVFTTGGAKAIAIEYGWDPANRAKKSSAGAKLAHGWAAVLTPAAGPVQRKIVAINKVPPHPFMRTAFDAVKGGAADDLASAATQFTASAEAQINSN